MRYSKPVVAILLVAIFAFGLIVWSQAVSSARATEMIVVQHELSRLRENLWSYANDHGGQLPQKDQWYDSLGEASFGYKFIPSDSKYTFAFNGRVGGLNLHRVSAGTAFNGQVSDMHLRALSASTILIAEYRAEAPNALLTDPNKVPEGRHGGVVAVLFASGEIHWIWCGELRLALED